MLGLFCCQRAFFNGKNAAISEKILIAKDLHSTLSRANTIAYVISCSTPYIRDWIVFFLIFTIVNADQGYE
jgi:hypothetical protein